MARGELIGLVECPECDFPDAEIRPDKSGAPYRFCPDCTAQYFSRGVPHKVKNLLAKVRPLAKMDSHATLAAPVASAAVMAAPVIPVPFSEPARKAFSMDQL